MTDKDKSEFLNKLIGLGKNSIQKSYYPKLQKKLEELESEKKKYKNIFENALNGIFRLDSDGVFKDLNIAMAKILSYKSTEEVSGKVNFRDAHIVSSNDWSELLDVLKSKRKVYDYILQLKTSVNFRKWVLLNLNMSQEGFIDGFAADIDDQVLTQNKLIQSRENLRSTLNSIGDGVITYDMNGVITNINPVAADKTGWISDSARGQKIEDVFRIYDKESGRFLSDPFKALSTGEINDIGNNIVLHSKSEEKFVISALESPIKNQENRIVGTVLVFRDITNEKEIENQLNHSRKMDAVGQLAGGIAHDFNNIIGGILGAAEVLRMKKVSEEDIKLIDIIINSALRATDINKKLLTFSRKNTVSLVPLDIIDSIKNSVDLLKHSLDKRVVITFVTDADKTIIAGDTSQLQNVFINLGINAGQAMPDGGLLEYRVSNEYIDPKRCGELEADISEGNFVRVDVKDSGSGIKSEFLGKIFDPFFTTKAEGAGTGLGLSAVYGIVKQHKGAALVESEPGQGSVFTLYFPLSADNVGQRGVSSEISVSSEGKGSILVVDDEEIILETTKLILESSGYRVYTAENGKKGLEVLRENRFETDLVILDMMMPEMNGQDVYLKIKEIKEDIDVILTTGLGIPDFTEKMRDADLKRILRKPYTKRELLKAVSEVLKSPF